MRFQCLVCLLLASLAYGQAAQPSTPPATPPTAGAPAPQSTPAPTEKAPEMKVAPDDPVITLKGFCTDVTKQGDACKTVVTRAQLEKVAEALQPGMPPALRRQLATRYAQVLRMSTKAEERGLDKLPAFEEKMHYARMQILSQELSSALQADSQKVTDDDVADYYKKNEASYEQANLLRIFVPKSKQVANPVAKPKPPVKPGTKAAAKADEDEDEKAAPQPTEAEKKAAEEAMTKLADKLRERAAKGGDAEDFDKLQKDAFAAGGITGNAINTKVEKARRSTLPPSHQAVMDLKPGEVSEVINDPNGHYFYKMVSKETLSLESVTPEIRKAISSQRYRESMQSFQGNVELNDAYFGPTRNPGVPPPPRGVRMPEHHADPD